MCANNGKSAVFSDSFAFYLHQISAQRSGINPQFIERGGCRIMGKQMTIEEIVASLRHSYLCDGLVEGVDDMRSEEHTSELQSPC